MSFADLPKPTSKQIVELGNNLLRDNIQRNLKFLAMDKYYNVDWDLPPKVKNGQWVHVYKSTDPHDAVTSSANILSIVKPEWDYVPEDDNQETIDKANAIEKAIEHNFELCSDRHDYGLVQGITNNMLLYGTCTALMRCMDIEYKGKPIQLKAAKRHGPFSITLMHPIETYPIFNEDYLEAMMVIRYHTKYTFKSAYPDLYTTLVDKMNSSKEEFSEEFYFVVYDYMDMKWRAKCASIVLDKPNYTVAPDMLVEPEESEIVAHNMPFLPYACKKVGNPQFIDENSYVPLLDSLYKSDHWENQNLILSVLISEVLKYAASPRYVVKTDKQTVEVDAGTPNVSVKLGQEDDMSPLPPPPIDSGLMTTLDMITGQIGKTTVSRMLQNPEAKADVPFSAMNLIFQLGANTLNPYKEASGNFIADIGRLFLEFTSFRGSKLIGYKTNKLDIGKRIEITKKDFDLENMVLRCKLTAEVPTDKLAKINAATIATQQLDYPKGRALKDTGTSDAEDAIAERRREETAEVEHQQKLKLMNAKTDQMIQMGAMKMQEQMQRVEQARQMQQAMQQQGMQTGAPGPVVQPGVNNAQPQLENLTGQGFDAQLGGGNVAAGGVISSPQQLSGMDQAGNNIM